MKLFRKLRFFAEDIWQTICCHKWLTLFCAFVAVAGAVVGGVLVKVFECTWWYGNRYEYAFKLFEGGFGLFFTFFLWTAIFYFCLLCCCVNPHLKYVSLLPMFVACFYCGANTAAAIMARSVWGILFAVLVTVAEVAGYFFAVLSLCCTSSARRTLREAYCDTKVVLGILIAAFLTKIFAFFVVLRLLTSII